MAIMKFESNRKPAEFRVAAYNMQCILNSMMPLEKITKPMNWTSWESKKPNWKTLSKEFFREDYSFTALESQQQYQE